MAFESRLPFHSGRLQKVRDISCTSSSLAFLGRERLAGNWAKGPQAFTCFFKRFSTSFFIYFKLPLREEKERIPEQLWK